MMRPEGERADASLGDKVRSHWQRLVQGSARGGWDNSEAMWKGEPEGEAAEWCFFFLFSFLLSNSRARPRLSSSVLLLSVLEE